MAKKTPREQIAASITAISTYQSNIKTGEMVLNMPEVQKNDSVRVAQESLVRGARENLTSEYNAIFRRVSEHVDSIVRDAETGAIDLNALKKFADKALTFSK